ncbi:E3 ubiquitin-protein ligase TRIM71-like [Ruditapes philippinarum]|uniref:E3 ubiquitin-protein ligase TRIM71-like n=1 Tax=Ruditapes philippinarum TaxID=129788 RepID=UPI00295BCAC8|nr:E3 ubiquitin-protein ligase TRIM71-like [Ruditapes philippinarum]
MAKKAYQKLTSILRKGSAEDFEVFCEPCDRADFRTPAFGYCLDCKEHLCQSCYSTHRRPKPLQHHQLIDNPNMSLQETLQKLSKSGEQADEFSNYCAKHIKEVIKLYCHDHSALVCSVCVALEHVSTSCHVDYIPDISGQTLNSTELNETLKDLANMQDKCIKAVDNLKQSVAKSTTSLKDAESDIANFRKDINTTLDELEREVKDIASTLQNDNNKKLQTTETTCDDINKSLQSSADTLWDLYTDKKVDQLFIELKIAQQLILDNKQKILQLPAAIDIGEYKFEPNQPIKTLLQNEKSLGTIRSKKHMQSAKPINQAMVEIEISDPKYINVKTPSDESDCRITGITFSPTQNQIFVADFINKSIKMIDIKSGVIQQLLVESKPCDITIITGDTLAVTLPRSHTIQFLSFSSNSVSPRNKLRVEGQCFGISHHQGKLAVAFPLQGSLLIMDLEGTVQIKLATDSHGDNIFSHPSYVTTDNKSIYVSDRDKSAILCLDWQGKVIRKYGGIKWPSGIALLDDGSFLVSDYKRHSIIKVSGDCQDSKIVLEDIESPWAMCWCANVSIVCVSRYNSSCTELNNHIELYKTI